MAQIRLVKHLTQPCKHDAPVSSFVRDDLSPLTAAACIGVMTFRSRLEVDTELYIPRLSLICQQNSLRMYVCMFVDGTEND